MKALVGAFNQEKALVGAFSVIVQQVVEPMDRFAALAVCATSPEHQLTSYNKGWECELCGRGGVAAVGVISFSAISSGDLFLPS